MKLSENTVEVLKNFASINANLVVEEGATIRTISEARNLLSTATVSESFDQRFGFSDVNDFLNVVGLVEEPELEFGEEFVTVTGSDGGSRVKFFYSDFETLTTPTKDITMPKAEIRFTLPKDTLNKLRRASGVLGYDELVITPNTEGSITLTVKTTEVISNSGDRSNSFSMTVDPAEGVSLDEKFEFVFDIKYLKMIEDDYDVEISSKLISHWTAKNKELEYWCALEKNSSYGG